MYKVTATVSHQNANKMLIEGIFIPSNNAFNECDAHVIKDQCTRAIKNNINSDFPVDELDINIRFKKMNLAFIVVEGKE